MADPGLNSLLKWSVENSEATRNDPTAQTDPKAERDPNRGLDPEVLARLMGGPSDADRMNDAMAAIVSPEVDLENKLIAFDNFEQLIENLDNANNMETLGLWMPLVQQLDHSEPELQFYASWCLGTAVQNNIKCQDRCLATGAVEKLVELAVSGETPKLRKKATYALSSEVRNYQPGFDTMVKELPAEYRGEDRLDANDMEAVDQIINRLREAADSS